MSENGQGLLDGKTKEVEYFFLYKDEDNSVE
jgi:hypothetical protein